MHPSFAKFADQLDAKYRELIAMPAIIAESTPAKTPTGGIYLFSENGIPLYTGRTKRNLSTRIRSHFGTALDCPFAWLLSREITGQKASYQKSGSRKDLLSQPDFRKIYEDSKARIRKMQVQYVHEPEPTRQALLEIYVAVCTDSKYNDFDTH